MQLAAARIASSACGIQGTAEAMCPCVGEKPGRPCWRQKASMSSRASSPSHDGQRGEQACSCVQARRSRRPAR